MEYFVDRESIVRKIWGKSDTVLFIFAGAAAEFALNKAVDWLYYTGRLPADPLGRLFSTVSYARIIVFSKKTEAIEAIDRVNAIHGALENQRRAAIPDWAYRDVLFMLIYYSIASFELLEHKLTTAEKEEVYDVFYRVGQHMHLTNLPINYTEWLTARKLHIKSDLAKSLYTTDLFLQYKKHLGAYRYAVLKEAQKLVLPKTVKELLNFSNFSLLSPVVPAYKFSRRFKADRIIKALLLPPKYKAQIADLDVQPA